MPTAKTVKHAVAKPAKKPLTKPSTSSARQPRSAKTAVVKPAAKPSAAPKAPARKAAIAKPAQAVKAAKPEAAAAAPKPPKNKLVRDSFTMPKLEYAVIESLKQRGAQLAKPLKKSEVLRAGVKALAAMSDEQFMAALAAVPAIKTGRPKSKKAVTLD
jgi:hypothetical protein